MMNCMNIQESRFIKLNDYFCSSSVEDDIINESIRLREELAHGKDLRGSFRINIQPVKNFRISSNYSMTSLFAKAAEKVSKSTQAGPKCPKQRLFFSNVKAKPIAYEEIDDFLSFKDFRPSVGDDETTPNKSYKKSRWKDVFAAINMENSTTQSGKDIYTKIYSFNKRRLRRPE